MPRAYGVAAVYVSHDLAVVGGLVSQVAVMYAGRVVEIGPTEQVFGLPVHPYTRGLLAAVPSPKRAEVLTGIEGQPPRPGRKPKGCAFAPRCSYAISECFVERPVPVTVGDRRVRCIEARDIENEAPDAPGGAAGCSRRFRRRDLEAARFGRLLRSPARAVRPGPRRLSRSLARQS